MSSVTSLSFRGSLKGWPAPILLFLSSLWSRFSSYEACESWVLEYRASNSCTSRPVKDLKIKGFRDNTS
jgi:hypothetical protein